MCKMNTILLSRRVSLEVADLVWHLHFDLNNNFEIIVKKFTLNARSFFKKYETKIAQSFSKTEFPSQELTNELILKFPTSNIGSCIRY